MSDDALASVLNRMSKLSASEREHIHRLMSGEADADLIRRGDVLVALREHLTNPVPSVEFQRGLAAARSTIAIMPAITTTA